MHNHQKNISEVRLTDKKESISVDLGGSSDLTNHVHMRLQQRSSIVYTIQLPVNYYIFTSPCRFP